MNKKNITLILAGIMLLLLQFNIRIGSVYVDLFPDILGAILIAIGGFPLTKRNLLFKKMRGSIILGLILTALGLFVSIYGGINNKMFTSEIALGLSTVFLIYFTYYFTEGLMLEAKFQEKEAVTRSFRRIWLILGILIFAIFFSLSSDISLISTCVQALAVIYAIYYCSAVLTACKQLYMEGLPTKHMDTSQL